jgi:DNA-binding response OmpR family regulator
MPGRCKIDAGYNAAMRIMVVDDNEDMRSMLKLCLEADGFDVDVARNGQLALERLQEQPADVVVTDLFMPDQDGIETILELRKRFPQVRIVAMSGWTSSEGSDYLRVAREIGALETLRKPFDPQELSRLLRALPR